jgi:hypothetical protein
LPFSLTPCLPYLFSFPYLRRSRLLLRNLCYSLLRDFFSVPLDGPGGSTGPCPTDLWGGAVLPVEAAHSTSGSASCPQARVCPRCAYSAGKLRANLTLTTTQTCPPHRPYILPQYDVASTSICPKPTGKEGPMTRDSGHGACTEHSTGERDGVPIEGKTRLASHTWRGH